MTPSRQDYLLLAALGLCWGTHFLAIKIAVADIPPATLTLGRLATGAALLLLVMKRRRLPWPTDAKTWAYLAAIALLGNAAPYALISWSEVYVASALAAIVIAATPLLTLLLAHFKLADETLSARRALGVGLGFAGVVVLIGVDALAGLGHDIWAQLALLGAALSFAVNAIVARQMPPTPAVTSAFGVTAIATIIMFPVAVVTDGLDLPQPSLAGLGAMLWLGVVSSALAMLIYFKLIASAGATFVSLANYLVPLLALGFGGALLGEVPSWNMLLALGLILVGVFLTGGRGRHRTR